MQIDEQAFKRERDLAAAWAKAEDEVKRLTAVLKKIESLEHDSECGSDQGSRDGNCMDDHRCYCAQRAARKALQP